MMAADNERDEIIAVMAASSTSGIYDATRLENL
jgi:hypothetical protein